MTSIAMKHSSSKARQLRFLSQSARLEEAVNPRIVTMTSWAVSLTVVAFLGWASVTSINEITRGPGEVIPQGFQQIVQHLEGGLVREIRVTEGDVVDKGQVLMVLDGAGTQEDLGRSLSEKVFLELQRERLKAYLENRKPDFTPWQSANTALVAEQKKIFDTMLDSNAKERNIIMDQIAQKKQSISTLAVRSDSTRKNLALTEDMYSRRKGLHDQGYISDMKLLESEQELNSLRGDTASVNSQIGQARQEIQEYQSRLKSLDAKNREQAYQQLNAIEGQLAQNSETVQKLNKRSGRLAITSPVHGLVKGLTVNTIGGVIQPGQQLMEIVPLDRKLEVEARIPPQQIGHIKVDMPVQVKVSTYDFARYGSITGHVETISPTTFEGERGERFYRVRIGLDRNYVGPDQKRNIIVPGMTVMADIVTGDKTILSYLLKPIHRSLQTSFTER
ncbi:MAG: type secretion rane fusion, HlyD family protein [Micavibrio sp.]|nr:type secretion rane fusion, HlyD family protein [Micavibrio sp.]